MRSQAARIKRFAQLAQTYKQEIIHYDDCIKKAKEENRLSDKQFIKGLRRRLIMCIKDIEEIVNSNRCIECTDINGQNIGNMYICPKCGRTVD